nr:DUF2064 domain-containing protein [uncultured Allomuricauda sp.]
MQQKLTQNTAVLLFANSAEEDCYIKKIADSKPLFDALTERTLRTVKATGLPFFHLTEKDQLGNTFGERFSNAIQQLFDFGYSQIITVGNDSPQLIAQHIIEAKNQLSEQNTVLGPSLDGGFYLLGIHRSNFNKETFESLPWQTARLYGETKEYFNSYGCEVLTLERLIDVDSISDIKQLSNYIKNLTKYWIGLFSGVLRSKNNFTKTASLYFQSSYLSVYFNKGSPFCFA